jgi:hypothetical protein
MAEKKIEDFGEKIEGARKDIAALRKGILELTGEMIDGWNSKEQEQYINKELVWKRPDYQEMVDNGLNREVAYFIKTVRDAIPAKPPVKSEEGRKGYVAFVQDVRDMAMKVQSHSDISSFKHQMIDKYLESTGIRSYYAKPECYGGFQTKLLRAINQTKSNLEREVCAKEFCYSEEEHLKHTYIQAVFSPGQYDSIKVQPNILGKGTSHEYGYLDIYATEKSAENSGFRSKSMFRIQDENRCCPDMTEADFEHDKFYVISKRCELLFSGIDTREEAERLALEWAKKAEQAKNPDKKKTGRSHKEKLLPPQLEHIQRNGEEHRERDMNVSGEDILESFKLRGGQFGNWTNQNDRQTNMNMLFDAFRDLAVALDIPYENVSLSKDNGERTASLAIAWGARGHSSALAHYEPLENVINLTKMRGAGSLAHEWGHALDCYVKEMAGLTAGYRADKAQKYMATHCVDKDNPFAAVIRTMNYKETPNGNLEATEYYKQAKKADKDYAKTDNGYWASACEMFARAFACYVSDKLQEKGVRSDYLTGHSEYTVYPTGEERQKINEAIDKLIDDLKERGYLKHQVHDIQAESKKLPVIKPVEHTPVPDCEYGEQMTLFDMMNSSDDSVPTKQEAEAVPVAAEMPLQETKGEPKPDDVTFLAQDFEIGGVSFDFEGEPTIRIKAVLPDDLSADDRKTLIERAGIHNPENIENLSRAELTLYLDYDENGAGGVLKASVGHIDLKEFCFDLNDSEIHSASQIAEQVLGHSAETERDAMREMAESMFDRSLEDKDIAE